MKNDDAEILLAVRRDPDRGFRMLMTQYQERLYRHAMRITRNGEDAADALQEAFVRAYRSLSKFRGECRLETWLYRITYNEAVRITGRHRQTLSLDDEEHTVQVAAPTADGTAAEDYAAEAAERLHKAVMTLPTKQRLAFCMRYYDEMSFEDIAETAGSTPASVKQSYHIAKERIKTYLQTHDE